MSTRMPVQAELTSRTRVQGMLLVSLVRVPGADEWSAVRQEILDSATARGVQGVVFDLAQADVLDDVDLEELLRTRSTIRLMGLDMVLSGLRPEVVHAWIRMTRLPPDLVGYSTVEDALHALQAGSRA